MDHNAPKYIQVYNQIKEDLLSLKYPPGSFLPPEDKLVELYAASKTTVRHAIAILKEDGFLLVQQGRGTEVLSPATETPTAYRYLSETQVSTEFLVEGEAKITRTNAIIDTAPATTRAAQALGVARGEDVYRIQRIHMVNGIAFAYWVSFFRPDLTPGLDGMRNTPSGLIGVLEQEYGFKVLRTEDRISAITAGQMESHFLKVETGAPLLQMRRIAISDRGPLEYVETAIKPELYQYCITRILDKEADAASPPASGHAAQVPIGW